MIGDLYLATNNKRVYVFEKNYTILKIYNPDQRFEWLNISEIELIKLLFNTDIFRETVLPVDIFRELE